MKVNKECFIKSVKHDYIYMAKIIVIFTIVGILALAATVLRNNIEPFFHAFNLFIIFQILVFALMQCVTAFQSREVALKDDVVGNCALIMFFHGMIYGGYWIIESFTVAETGAGFPDVFPLFLGFTLLSVICEPLTLAYARCKDEETKETKLKDQGV